MNWSASRESRYLILAVTVLAVFGLVDGLVRSLAGLGGIGFALAIWACYGVVFAWILMEPMVRSFLLQSAHPCDDPQEKLRAIAHSVAQNMGMPTPRVQVYDSDRFNAMTSGIGPGVTIFLTSGVATLDKDVLRAIIAHECGHIRLHHIELRFFMLGSLLMLVLMANGLSLVAVGANLFVLWSVRQMEFQADAAAASTVGIQSMARALEHALGVVGELPRWSLAFNSHPQFRSRLKRLNDSQI